MTQQTVETFFHEDKNKNPGLIEVSQPVDLMTSNLGKIQGCQVTLFDHSHVQFSINNKNYWIHSKVKIEPKYLEVQQRKGIVDILVIHLDQNMM